jgi:hypothetical protein
VRFATDCPYEVVTIRRVGFSVNNQVGKSPATRTLVSPCRPNADDKPAGQCARRADERLTDELGGWGLDGIQVQMLRETPELGHPLWRGSNSRTMGSIPPISAPSERMATCAS